MPSRHPRHISKPCNIISPDWTGPAALLGSFAEVASPAKTAVPSANTPATELLEIDVTSPSGGLGTVSSCRRSPRIGACSIRQNASSLDPTTDVLLPLESCLDIVPATKTSLNVPSKGGKLVKARKKSPAVDRNEKQEYEPKPVSQRSPRREGLRGETVVPVAGSGLPSCCGAVASQVTAVVAKEDISVPTGATPISGKLLNTCSSMILLIVCTSVQDPWLFVKDPDLRIRTSDKRIRLRSPGPALFVNESGSRSFRQ
jgi:hypothetical protein